MEEWCLIPSMREALLVVHDQELHVMGFLALLNCIQVGAWMTQILIWVNEDHFASTCYKTREAHILESWSFNHYLWSVTKVWSRMGPSVARSCFSFLHGSVKHFVAAGAPSYNAMLNVLDCQGNLLHRQFLEQGSVSQTPMSMNSRMGQRVSGFSSILPEPSAY